MLKGLIKLLFKIIFFVILLSSIIIGFIYLKEKNEFEEQYTENIIKERIEEIRGQYLYTKTDEIDDKYLKSVIAVEDHRFYNHGPFDVKSLLRATFVNIKNKEILEGGSTITQQFVKNAFFNQDVNLERKIKEAFMSVEIEKMYSKEDILELYVNTSYFGSGYYSIKEASLGYFGKSPDNLEMVEAAFLAGVPNAPSKYDPRVDEILANQRYLQVIKKIDENTDLDDKIIEELKNLKIEVIPFDEGLEYINEEIKKEKEESKETETKETETKD